MPTMLPVDEVIVATLPDPPTRNDAANFPERGDQFMTALPPFGVQMNALRGDVVARHIEVAAALTTALASVVSAGVTKWLAATAYAQGDCVWSPVSFQTYRRKVAGTTGADPSADAANWAQVSTMPSMAGMSGYVLSTNGTNAVWTQKYPSMTGKAGMFLTNNGASEAWAPIPPHDLFLISNGAI